MYFNNRKISGGNFQIKRKGEGGDGVQQTEGITNKHLQKEETKIAGKKGEGGIFSQPTLLD